ncbi:formate dehydrogenase accessory sulfurtransferase FdhD [Teichococcus rhizosphaerae]|nr:formate dehydrogenase accessory sulfurtransferase FdhD [Pseudoroseomonas rhizosphaerae]
MMMQDASARPSLVLPRLARQGDRAEAGFRTVAEETAVALTYGRSTHAVMMASPMALEELGLGFSLTEGLIGEPAEMLSLDVVPRPAGIELRMELAEHRAAALASRRRRLAGPLGCGLCGIESLEAASRSLPAVADPTRLPASEIEAGMEALSAAQALHRETRAAHAAGFWRSGEGLVLLREDVGRHNALDKLAGALARQERRGGQGLAAGGALLLTSRVSVEMVQKAAMIGAPLLVAVSAPTALAIRVAEQCGITLVALARGACCEIFTHPGRIH